MNFQQALQQYIGRTIEVLTVGSLLTGTLLQVGEGFLVLRTSSNYYNPVEGDVTVFFTNIEFVRVLP
ncbi:hypothetical protein [Paenibacillus tarimensis]|uniref:hypothetical protein n=1 Tax=Paenibacillus tarimensis TaxID=416012 RepID=UPI001F20D84F|nr:hypothetical protein [Paenibacillus tarimensis]MCF2944913.1 hypothetical protein [Paenibacillus tarimensis]